MELEIDRRCPDCGAAVRQQAAFCPQCGRTMRAADATPPPTPPAAQTEANPLMATMQSPEPPEPIQDGKRIDNSTRPLAATSPGIVDEPPTAAKAPSPTEPSPKAPAPTVPASTVPSTPDTISLPAKIAREQIASGKPVESLPEHASRAGRGGRVVGAARDVVEERLAPRVEKLRQASTVVWGEAQDDPNLRFILIALVLFIVALVIILLGTYLR